MQEVKETVAQCVKDKRNRRLEGALSKLLNEKMMPFHQALIFYILERKNCMKEIWKDVTGFEGRYKVSNFGKVLTYLYGEWKPKAQYKTRSGYMYATLYSKKKKWQGGVHILVAKEFVPGYQPGLEVNHKDLNKLNNRYDNLEWVTHQKNQQHQFTKKDKNYKPTYCIKCGKELTSNKGKYCLNCFKEHKREKWPSLEEMKQYLMYLNFTQIGKIFGKSDNWVRRVCRYYGLPTTYEERINFIKYN